MILMRGMTFTYYCETGMSRMSGYYAGPPTGYYAQLRPSARTTGAGQNVSCYRYRAHHDYQNNERRLLAAPYPPPHPRQPSDPRPPATRGSRHRHSGGVDYSGRRDRGQSGTRDSKHNNNNKVKKHRPSIAIHRNCLLYTSPSPRD